KRDWSSDVCSSDLAGFVLGFRVRESGVVGVVPNVCGDGFECGAGVHARGGFDRVVVVHVVPGVDGELVTERGGGVDSGCGLADEVVGDHRCAFLSLRTVVSLIPVPRLLSRAYWVSASAMSWCAYLYSPPIRAVS